VNLVRVFLSNADRARDLRPSTAWVAKFVLERLVDLGAAKMPGHGRGEFRRDLTSERIATVASDEPVVFAVGPYEMLFVDPLSGRNDPVRVSK
jgi:hypothetical protein